MNMKHGIIQTMGNSPVPHTDSTEPGPRATKKAGQLPADASLVTCRVVMSAVNIC